MRDKLLSSELDAAHTLYGLVYGVQLGIGGPQADMAIPMVLNHNGQAIKLFTRLAQALHETGHLGAVLAALEDVPIPPEHRVETFRDGVTWSWRSLSLSLKAVG